MKNQEDLSFDEKESLDRICGNKTETVGDIIEPPVAKHPNKKD
jgi:hypothetical protein